MLAYTPNNGRARPAAARLAGCAGQRGARRTATVPRRPLRRAACSSASASRWPVSPTSTAPCASATTRRTSALDVHCKAHDLDNLYVVDGSFFPSSGAVNPGLTIMANALRVGDHLLERLGASASARRWPMRARDLGDRRASSRWRWLVAGGLGVRPVRAGTPRASDRAVGRRVGMTVSDMDRSIALLRRRARLRGRCPTRAGRAARTSCSTGVFGARMRVRRAAARRGASS